MPQLEICAYCKKAINPDDQWVEVKPPAQDSPQFGVPMFSQFAHARCHDQMEDLDRDMETK